MIQAVTESEFDFRAGKSNLPTIPLGWVTATRYGESRLVSDVPGLEGLSFTQTSVSHALALPVVIRKRDMLVVGYYLSSSHLEFENAPVASGDLHQLGLGFSWLHQSDPDWMTAAFVAPLFHSRLDGSGPVNVEWFAGYIARYYQGSTFYWLFGSAYQNGFGKDYFYPYLGAVWTPNEDWSIAMTLPWPTISYALTPEWSLRVGAMPSGAKWVAENSKELSVGFSGWDVGISAESRLYKNLWLAGSIGWTGLRGVGVTAQGDVLDGSKLDSKPLVKISVNLRI